MPIPQRTIKAIAEKLHREVCKLQDQITDGLFKQKLQQEIKSTVPFSKYEKAVLALREKQHKLNDQIQDLTQRAVNAGISSYSIHTLLRTGDVSTGRLSPNETKLKEVTERLIDEHPLGSQFRKLQALERSFMIKLDLAASTPEVREVLASILVEIGE